MRFALIVSEYYQPIARGLEAGARAVLAEAGAADRVDRFVVPGAYEIPQLAQRLAETGRFAAVIGLGCLIRGETAHFDYISQAVSQGLMRAAQATGVPMAFGVLTTNNLAEAVARSADDEANKGREAAAAAVAMARLYRGLDPAGARGRTSGGGDA